MQKQSQQSSSRSELLARLKQKYSKPAPQPSQEELKKYPKPNILNDPRLLGNYKVADD